MGLRDAENYVHTSADLKVLSGFQEQCFSVGHYVTSIKFMGIGEMRLLPGDKLLNDSKK